MEVTLVSDSIWTYVQDYDLDVPRILKLAFTYKEDGYQYTIAHKRGKWNGDKTLYDSSLHRFRRGLLNRAIEVLNKSGYLVKTKSKLIPTVELEHKLNLGSIVPHQYQISTVQSVLKNDIGIFVSPTGSGKTLIIAILLAKLKCRSIVLVTDLVLLDQMVQNLSTYFSQPIGIIGDSEFNLQDITVSTIQSIASINKARSIINADKRNQFLNHIKTVNAVIADEAHLTAINTVAEIIQLFTSTNKFISCSGTPYGYKDDEELVENKVLEQHFGTIIADTRNINFIKLGVKAPLIVQVKDIVPLSKKYNNIFKKNRFSGKMELDVTANYKLALNSELLNNHLFHEQVAADAIELSKTGKTVMVFATHSIEHCTSIHKLIPGAAIITGTTSREDRRKIYQDMREHKISVLVSDIGSTGLDIKNLDCMILASDITDVRQLKGRVERAAPGKQFGILIDYRIRTTYLDKHFKSRLSQYQADNNQVING